MPLLTHTRTSTRMSRAEACARVGKDRSGWAAAFLLFLFSLVLQVSGKCLHAAPLPGNEVKAVLLFHLTQFVSWPSPPPAGSFRIGVLGPNPFAGALIEAVDKESVNGQPIQVKRETSSKHLQDCQVVYVSSEAHEPLDRVFSHLKGLPVLTVGESADFLAQGGMIRITRTPDNKLRLQIDLERVRSAGLRVSAQLLRVADVVSSSPP